MVNYKLNLQCYRPTLSHCLNQCWNIVNSNIKNKFQSSLKRNSYIFIQEKTFENVICEMAALKQPLQKPALCLLQNQLCAVPEPAAPKPALCGH